MKLVFQNHILNFFCFNFPFCFCFSFFQDNISVRYRANAKRSCTDVCFLLFFILFLSFWGFMVFHCEFLIKFLCFPSFYNTFLSLILVPLFFHFFVLVSKRIDLSKTIYPKNSYGEVCGQGRQEGKPYLVFFNIFRCVASPESSIIEGCHTPQVCVESCPNRTFSINAQDPQSSRETQAQLAICLPNIVPTAKNVSFYY